MLRPLALLPLLAIAACAAPAADFAKLAPRAGERLDPRLPVAPLRSATPLPEATRARIAGIVASAEASLAPFDRAMIEAARLADGAGGMGSESWVVAQQALSAAQAQRAPLTAALADLDAMLAATIAGRERLPSTERVAILEASKRLAAIADVQQGRIAAVEGLLRR